MKNANSADQSNELGRRSGSGSNHARGKYGAQEAAAKHSPPGGGTSPLVAGNVSSGNRTGQMTMSSKRKQIETRKTESLVRRSADGIFSSLAVCRQSAVGFTLYRTSDA